MTNGSVDKKASKPMEILNSRRRPNTGNYELDSKRDNSRSSAQAANKTIVDHLAVKKRHCLSSNNATESSSDHNSLNDSSSVEVLSEIDDEARFENSLSSFNQFES